MEWKLCSVSHFRRAMNLYDHDVFIWIFLGICVRLLEKLDSGLLWNASPISNIAIFDGNIKTKWGHLDLMKYLKYAFLLISASSL